VTPNPKALTFHNPHPENGGKYAPDYQRSKALCMKLSTRAVDCTKWREHCANMPAPSRPETEDVKAIWRVGLVVYRDACRRMLMRSQCYDAGRTAIIEAFPSLTPAEASAHIVHAVAWASIQHHAWLWRGVPHREWIWPPDKRGVGLHRNPGYEDA
jgi:hypothetical protein